MIKFDLHVPLSTSTTFSQTLLRWFKGIWVCDLYCKVSYMMWNDPFWPSLVGTDKNNHYILLALKYKSGFECSPQYLYNMRAREQFCSQSLLRWFTVFVCKLQHQMMPWQFFPVKNPWIHWIHARIHKWSCL